MNIKNLTYQLVVKIFKNLNLDLFIKPTVNSFINHSNYIPVATYSPWNSNKEFLKIYELVKDYTMVDIYRLFELWNLIDNVKNVEGAILEVGVWRGGSGSLMASKAKMLGIECNVYLCDTYEGIVKASTKDNTYKGGELSNTSVDYVERITKKLDLNNVKILKGIFPDQTVDMVTDNNFRIIHIDVDVYESAKDIFEWGLKRLSPGGIIIFDDYGFPHCKGITDYVNEIRNNVNLFFIHNLNGHAIFIKI